MSVTYNDTYNKRYDKIKETVAFKNKHVTAIYAGMATPAKIAGITIAEYMADRKNGDQRMIGFADDLAKRGPVDGFNTGYMGFIHVMETMVWWSHIKMPGKELPPDSIWQVAEAMNIEPADYDFIIQNGMDAMTQKLLPKLLDMAEFQAFVEESKYQEQTTQKYVDAGYPQFQSGTICPPFETLCGGRSMGKFFMDCYKMLDKVKATQDVMMDSVRKQINALPQEKYMLSAWIGGWRGASSMVNQKIWDTLVWPYMKECAELLLAKGIIPVMHLDACWDRDIERFRELPARSIILNTDGMTDLRKARKILGSHCAFMGDVPPPMLAVASKAEVEDYVKRLIDDIGVEGLLLCPGCDAPANAQFENMAAIYETAAKY